MAIRLPEQDTLTPEAINALRHEYDDEHFGGWLSTLVWNTRNRYMAEPDQPIEAAAVRLLVEGFMAEIERIKREGA